MPYPFEPGAVKQSTVEPAHIRRVREDVNEVNVIVNSTVSDVRQRVQEARDLVAEQVATGRETLASATADIGAVRTAAAGAAAEVAAARTVVATLTTEAAQARGVYQTLNARFAAIDARFAAIDTRFTALEARVSALEALTP
jgi:chromosome segregation ATPase